MRHITHRRSLVAAGLGTLGVAAAQAMMPFSRSVVNAFSGPSGWSTPLLVAASLAVAAVVGYMGACALSLAGFIGPLPLRRVMVGLAAAAFTIRGFTLVPQLLAETGLFDPADGGTRAQLLASAASLGLGVLYCMGLTQRRSPATAHR